MRARHDHDTCFIWSWYEKKSIRVPDAPPDLDSINYCTYLYGKDGKWEIWNIVKENKMRMIEGNGKEKYLEYDYWKRERNDNIKEMMMKIEVIFLELPLSSY